MRWELFVADNNVWKKVKTFRLENQKKEVNFAEIGYCIELSWDRINFQVL
jgi:hypothetical protein